MKTILNVDSYTFFHFEKLIGRYIIYLFEKQHPKKVLKDSNKEVKNLNSFSKVAYSLVIVGESLTAYYTFKDNFEKCKYKDEDAFYNSIFQTGTNVWTNKGFIIQVLGSFIPIPFVGTIVGAFTGSIIGSFVNSLYDLEC